MIYVDPVPPKRDFLHTWMIYICFLNWVLHTPSWSFLSLEQLNRLPSISFIAEAQRMAASKNAAHYAAAYAELMLILVPFVILILICVPILVARRFLVFAGHIKRDKLELPWVFWAILFMFVSLVPFFFSTGQQIFTLSAVTSPVKWPVFLIISGFITCMVMYNSVIAPEAIILPHSEKFIRFSNLKELGEHPVGNMIYNGKEHKAYKEEYFSNNK